MTIYTGTCIFVSRVVRSNWERDPLCKHKSRTRGIQFSRARFPSRGNRFRKFVEGWEKGIETGDCDQFVHGYAIPSIYWPLKVHLRGRDPGKGIVYKVNELESVPSGSVFDSVVSRFPGKSTSIDEYRPPFDDSKVLELSPGHSWDRMTDMGQDLYTRYTGINQMMTRDWSLREDRCLPCLLSTQQLVDKAHHPWWSPFVTSIHGNWIRGRYRKDETRLGANCIPSSCLLTNDNLVGKLESPYVVFELDIYVVK